MKLFESHEIGPLHLKQIGGKASGLLWLRSQGVQVPRFYVIPADQFESTSTSQSLSEQISQCLDLHPQLFNQPMAVRSSGLEEDGSEDSFAGIHLTELNVIGKENLVQSICRVFLSARQEMALNYRQQKGLQSKNLGQAVILQEMVAAEAAGVSFGVDLQTGCKSSAWISCTQGLGESLVSGEVNGVDFVYDSLAADKSLQKVSPEDSSARFNEEFLAQVGQKTLLFSKMKAKPQDIEWAYDKKTLWFLQIRPVTSEVIEKSLPTLVFDNSNIQESYCGVTTPLTFTYAVKAYSKVYTKLMQLMQLPDHEIKQAEWSLENMLGYINGRVYYNINNWYAGLLYFPSFGKRKEEMENMMGLDQPVDFVQGHQLSAMQKFSRLPRMMKLIANMIYRFARIDHYVHDYDQWFWKLYKKADIQGVYALSEFEIYEKIRLYQDLFVEKWGIPVLNDTKVMMDMGKVKRTLEKYNFGEELKSVIYGSEIESLQPTLEIHRLSKIFSAKIELKSVLFEQKGPELLKTLELFYPQEHSEIKNYIDLYGDRCMGELKLETITPRQDSEIIFSLIRQFIQSGQNEKINLFKNHCLSTDEVFKTVIEKMSPLEVFFFRRNVKALKKSVAAREKMRLHRSRNFGLMRALYLALGKKWATRKLLQSERDIFYLTHDEVFQIGAGKMATLNLKDLVDLRRKGLEGLEEDVMPAQIKISFPALYIHQNIAQPSDSQLLNFKGLPCSQGVIEGEIAFVREAKDIVDLKGKILLAERTDPGWTPLFAMINGVIIERGSMLSHSAVIAREMGIPAVIGISNITKILKNGDWVRLDGYNGTVEIKSRIAETEISSLSIQ